MIDPKSMVNAFLRDYHPRARTMREQLRALYVDRIRAAWRVLIGKAWAEEY